MFITCPAIFNLKTQFYISFYFSCSPLENSVQWRLCLRLTVVCLEMCDTRLPDSALCTGCPLIEFMVQGAPTFFVAFVNRAVSNLPIGYPCGTVTVFPHDSCSRTFVVLVLPLILVLLFYIETTVAYPAEMKRCYIYISQKFIDHIYLIVQFI